MKAELQNVNEDAGKEENEENTKDDTSFIANKTSKVEILLEACSVANQVIKLTRSADASGADKTADMTSIEFLESHAKLDDIVTKLNECIAKAKKLYPVGIVSTTFSKNSKTTGLLEKFYKALLVIIPELDITNTVTLRKASSADIIVELKTLDEALGNIYLEGGSSINKVGC